MTKSHRKHIQKIIKEDAVLLRDLASERKR